MLTLGDFVSAEKACEIGLINRAVPEAQLQKAAQTMATAIASKSLVAVRLGKEAFYRQAEMDLDTAYQYTGSVMADNMMANDAEEGIGAFIAKKPRLT